MQIEDIKTISDEMIHNIQSVIVGKKEVIRLITTAILCSGHILLEDIPGMGKTLLAKSLAKSMTASFSRIQFTPDLLPADLTGLNFYNQKTGEFEFRRGPLMHQIILADEINRATPRTQSSLLEAMEEHQITVDGTTYPLEEPFLVIATQNPIEIGGTFPLPEAQLDRFFMQLSMGYPSLEEEHDILKRFRESNPLESLKPVISAEKIRAARMAYTQVEISEDLVQYLLAIVRATREHPAVTLGISPRGTMALYRAAQAYAATNGRSFVLPDDIQALIMPVLGHRLKLKSYGYVESVSPSSIFDEILQSIDVPVENL